MKVAIIHDWFKANGGAEKVAGDIIDVYLAENPDLYSLFDKFKDKDRKSILRNLPVNTSLLQNLPMIEKVYQGTLPLMPWLIERFNLKGYDAIISTSHAVAKSIGCDKNILNICYCHTPMRFAWDMMDDYKEQHKFTNSFLYNAFMKRMRDWDKRTAEKVHYFIANSHHIKNRIKNCYGRDATVIYPPVRVEKFELYEGARQDYYLALGRFVPYKKIDLIVKSFLKMPDKKLVLIGEGYGSRKFADLIQGATNIEWLGYQPDDEMIRYIQQAKACIFAAKEDFGIQCVEVQACGTPVIALDYGGYQETVVNGVTGYHFPDQTEEAVIGAVKKLEANYLNDAAAISRHAEKFSSERFKREIKDFVNKCHHEFYGH